MTPETLQAIQTGGWAVAFAVVGYPLVTRVLSPLTKHFVSKMNGGNGTLWDKVDKMENNHLTDIEKRLSHIEDRINELNTRVSRIEGRLDVK